MKLVSTGVKIGNSRLRFLYDQERKPYTYYLYVPYDPKRPLIHIGNFDNYSNVLRFTNRVKFLYFLFLETDLTEKYLRFFRNSVCGLIELVKTFAPLMPAGENPTLIVSHRFSVHFALLTKNNIITNFGIVQTEKPRWTVYIPFPAEDVRLSEGIYEALTWALYKVIETIPSQMPIKVLNPVRFLLKSAQETLRRGGNDVCIRVPPCENS